jgi:penicillin amidase
MTACGRPAPPPAPRAPALPQTSGTLAVAGLAQPVRVIRDRFGVPHITAQSERDLFFAQGFVQAQDRLFQMDLWRRSSQGRLAEVLGPNFIDRDAMTRRVQYHGDLAAEWASYGPHVEAIADAFVAGINAWVAIAREDLPQEFALAGWRPGFWKPEDLLNRTDAFLQSGDAALEAVRAQLAGVIGVERTAMLLPGNLPRGLPAGADAQRIGEVVSDALRRVGTPPFFSGFAAPFQAGGTGSNAWAFAASRSTTGAPLVANDPHRPLVTPSLRYLVHLQAPGWNVIGASSPWLPGVAIGHNDRVAWGIAAAPADTQDIYVEPASASVERVKDPIVIKGQATPFAFEREYTRQGVVIASDREHGLVFTLRWSGFLPGGSGELAALGVDRATNVSELRDALRRWKMPVVDVVYADAAGIGQQPTGAPASPSSGATVIAANGSAARTNRLNEMFAGAAKYGVDEIKRQQHDITSWNAGRLVPRFAPLHSPDARVEEARRQLVEWDRRMTPDSPAAALYVAFERALWRRMAEVRVPAPLLDDYLASAGVDIALAMKAGDALLLDALATAVEQTKPRTSDVTFKHPLAITQASRRLFNVGPFTPGGYDATVNANFTRSNLNIGASFRQIVDLSDWDRSVATAAPGQSEWPRSPHFSDLAKLWAAGEYFLLAFSDRAVQANAEATLTLTPK